MCSIIASKCTECVKLCTFSAFFEKKKRRLNNLLYYYHPDYNGNDEINDFMNKNLQFIKLLDQQF